ncbi:hypothetical protein [Micromonospora sp. DT47]
MPPDVLWSGANRRVTAATVGRRLARRERPAIRPERERADAVA